MELRCNFTGNLCGTDTWSKYQPCVCGHCQRWLCEEFDKLQTALAAAKESIEELEAKLESENDHSRFLESLLEYVYGEGWETLTIHEAKKYRKRITAIETTAQERIAKLSDENEFMANQLDIAATKHLKNLTALAATQERERVLLEASKKVISEWNGFPQKDKWYSMAYAIIDLKDALERKEG